MPTRLAIVVTHQTQHFVSYFRARATDPGIKFHVLDGASMGAKSYFDEMQSEIRWKMGMLGGHSQEFLGEVLANGQSSLREPSWPQSAARLNASDPDVVRLMAISQANVYRAIWWSRRNKVPLITIGDSELLRERTTATRMAKEGVVHQIFRRCSAFLSVGDRNADFYVNYGVPRDRVFRCPLTGDEPSYRAEKPDRAGLRTEARRTYDVADDASVALFAGKLFKHKRPSGLIEALAQTKDRKVAGNGEQVEAAKTRASQGGVDARFAGFVNTDKLPAPHAAADVPVHLSRADPKPLIRSKRACIELSMLLSDRVCAAGLTDLARPGGHPLIFPCADVAALAALIDELSGDDAPPVAMGARSLEIFDELDIKAGFPGVHRGIDTALGRPR